VESYLKFSEDINGTTSLHLGILYFYGCSSGVTGVITHTEIVKELSDSSCIMGLRAAVSD
jgi:hypothetical protein